jgi:hypothetical protein
MARKTDSLRSLILRLLIAAAIAGVLGLCSLAIEQMKGFFKRSAGAGIHKIIGTPALVLPVYRRHPVRTISVSRELQQEHISGSRQSTTDSSAQYRAVISAASRSPRFCASCCRAFIDRGRWLRAGEVQPLPETPPVPETPSIVVLPFQNLSGDPAFGWPGPGRAARKPGATPPLPGLSTSREAPGERRVLHR